jgi:hypothetical protein
MPKENLTTVFIIKFIFLKNKIICQCMVLDQIMSYGIEVLYVSKYELR